MKPSTVRHPRRARAALTAIRSAQNRKRITSSLPDRVTGDHRTARTIKGTLNNIGGSATRTCFEYYAPANRTPVSDAGQVGASSFMEISNP